MILAVDVHYTNDSATVAGVTFEHWTDESETGLYLSHLSGIKEYISGQFYKRELPCILKLLEEHRLFPDIIVIDGFVHLDATSTPGLGLYLFNALNKKVPVIGAAKNPFAGIPEACKLLRGQSKKPLFITSAGIPLEQAKDGIRRMSGKDRIPVLLKKADQLSREK